MDWEILENIQFKQGWLEHRYCYKTYHLTTEQPSIIDRKKFVLEYVI